MSRDPFSPDPREPHDAESVSPNDRSRLPSSRASRHAEQRVVDRNVQRVPRTLPKISRGPEALDSARAHDLGDRTYFVRESELQTLVEVGTFRVVTAPDLARISYGGDARRMEREVHRLKEQSLLAEKVVPADRNKRVRLFALTKKGARLVRNSESLPAGQAIYHGFVKPREAKHDADLYRLYPAEVERIEQAGGRPTRVVLDYELKRDLNRDLAAFSPAEMTPEIREAIAERHGLAVVDGKIPVPDLRVEYDTAEMERKFVDLELATRNYRPGALAQKAKAGFSLYARREDASRLRRVLDEREITAVILSL